MIDSKEMIEVSANDLRQVLAAACGPDHLMRELQAIMKLPDTPLRNLVDTYNGWVTQKQEQKGGPDEELSPRPT